MMIEMLDRKDPAARAFLRMLACLKRHAAGGRPDDIIGREASAMQELAGRRASPALCALCAGKRFSADRFRKMALKGGDAVDPDTPWPLWTIVRDVRDAGRRALPVMEQMLFWQESLSGFGGREDGFRREISPFLAWLERWEARKPGDPLEIMAAAAAARWRALHLWPDPRLAALLDLRIQSHLFGERPLFSMSEALLEDAGKPAGDLMDYTQRHAFRAVCGMWNSTRRMKE